MATATLSDRITHLKVESLKLHKDAGIVPNMRTDEWTSFLADVGKRGVQEPIVVQEGGTILDGRNRWEAAKIAGRVTVPCRTVNLSEKEQIEYIIKSALCRRHLNDSQRGILGAKLAGPLSAAAQSEAGKVARASHGGKNGNPHDSSPPAKSSRTDTRKDVAKLVNVSEKTMQKAMLVLKKDPEVAARVLAGDVSLNNAVKAVAPESSIAKPNGSIPKRPPLKATANALQGKGAACRTLVESLQDLANRITEITADIKSTEGRLKTHEFDVEEQSKRMRMARTLVMQVRSTIKGD